MADEFTKETFPSFDRIINVKFTTETGVTIETGDVKNVNAVGISNKAFGIKPDISVEYNVIPGNNIYQIRLSIRNFNCPFNIRKFAYMDIELGYKAIDRKWTLEQIRSNNGKLRNTTTLNCVIFSAYQESPNPDGMTVFEAVVVGSVKTKDYTTKVHLYSPINYTLDCSSVETISVDALLKQIASQLGLELDLSLLRGTKNGKTFLESSITLNKTDEQFKTGYALLDWLNSTLKQHSEDLELKMCFVYPFNDSLIVMIDVESSIDYKKLKDRWVILDHIYGASFTGPILTVQAPFNPHVLPGALIYVEPKFFNGSRMPNFFEERTYNPADNLYQVLKMNVKFGTLDNNISVIDAMPVKLNKTAIEYQMETMDEYAKRLAERTMKDVQDVVIELKGNMSKRGESLNKKVPVVSGEQEVYGSGANVLISGNQQSKPDGFDASKLAGKGLAAIAKAFYGNEKALGSNQYAYEVYWVFIAIATYRKKRSTPNSAYGAGLTGPGDRTFELYEKADVFSEVFVPSIDTCNNYVKTSLGKKTIEVFADIFDRLGKFEGKVLGTEFKEFKKILGV